MRKVLAIVLIIALTMGLTSCGTKVMINANVNGILVSTEGIAMENGRKDRYISVKNAVSGKILRAKVIDENNVEVAA